MSSSSASTDMDGVRVDWQDATVSVPTGACVNSVGCENTDAPGVVDEMGDKMFGNLVTQGTNIILGKGSGRTAAVSAATAVDGSINTASPADRLNNVVAGEASGHGEILFGVDAGSADIMTTGRQGATSWMGADGNRLSMDTSFQGTNTYESGGQLIIADGSAIIIQDGGDLIHDGQDPFDIDVGGNDAIHVATDGNIGIGTDDPGDAQLAVEGDIAPATNATYSLGNNTHRWTDVYLDSVIHHIGDLVFIEDDEAIETARLTMDGDLQIPGNLAVGRIELGVGNDVTGSNSFASGRDNEVFAQESGVLSGLNNKANGLRSGVLAGEGNEALSSYTVVGGGQTNQATGAHSSILGGFENDVLAAYSAIGGGQNNLATGNHSAISGGQFNRANGANTGVGGGFNNEASAPYAFVGGGLGNLASGESSTVGGGTYNDANHYYAVVAGGGYNHATEQLSTVGGGRGNWATEYGATVAGGEGNTASGSSSAIAGGQYGVASGAYAFVGAGQSSQATGWYSVVPGGYQNTATGFMGAILGGADNVASGAYSAILGGANNEAVGYTSVAAGEQAHAIHDGAFVWADHSAIDLTSEAPDQFLARASGGYKFLTGTGGSGAELDSGTGSWASLSDVNMKENLVPVDTRAVLDAIAEMPVQEWSYITEDGVRHMGPTAQDFHAAFGLGPKDTTITNVDADGVSMAAIQALYDIVKEQQAQIEALTLQGDSGEIDHGAAETESVGAETAASWPPAMMAVLGALLVLVGLLIGLVVRKK